MMKASFFLNQPNKYCFEHSSNTRLLSRPFPKTTWGLSLKYNFRPDEVLSQKQKILNYFASKVKATTLPGNLVIASFEGTFS